ncbi:hypothetical protein RHSIM_Rhsim08G0166000 [Rhododendron simsii]|uniref:C-JID domain-containing protein n=1 Tax=Rhododendron simsii TaxID=118357 RepID=A0A834GKJ7_RHOSS|nr:hypothetical protein RHSIM_Rhsim08G0166000 [Rhododendron simsii]
MSILYQPGDEVPNWFQYQYRGSKFSLVVPPLETRGIMGWILRIVFRTHEKPGQRSCMYIFSKKTEGLQNENKHKTGVTYQDEDRMKLLYFPSNLTGIHLYGGDELEIEISSLDPEKTVSWLTVKKCGIKLVYEDEEHIIGCQWRIVVGPNAKRVRLVSEAHKPIGSKQISEGPKPTSQFQARSSPMNRGPHTTIPQSQAPVTVRFEEAVAACMCVVYGLKPKVHIARRLPKFLNSRKRLVECSRIRGTFDMSTEEFDGASVEGFSTSKYQDMMRDEPGLLHLGGDSFCFLMLKELDPDPNPVLPGGGRRSHQDSLLQVPSWA